MPNTSLTAKDIQEMLSSLFMAELSYDARMRLAEGASLPPEFIPTSHEIPNLDTVSKTICAMFQSSHLNNFGTASLRELASTLFDQWRNNKKNITFFTSGSTGIPKPSTHDFAFLVQEVEALKKKFLDRKRIVSFVPRHHIYGFLFSILLPKIMDIDVQWKAPLPMPGLTASLNDHDLIIAFPLLWQKLMEMDVKFGPNLRGVTSTGPCPANVIKRLRTQGMECIYEIYGSSETGGIGYRTNPDQGYRLLPFWNKTTSDAYLKRIHPKSGFSRYQIQDILQWKGDTFKPQRRTDGAIQVAGVNVYPSIVRETLLECPEVDDCAVRLMRPEEGERLKAFIILNSSTDRTSAALTIRKWANKNLSPCETPRTWTFGDTLPQNELGKKQDW